MARTSPPVTIEEIPGTEFSDLDAAQRSARSILARDFSNLVKQMIEQGTLEVRDHKIQPRGQTA